MSADLLSLLDYASFLVASIILVLAAYRGVEMLRAFVNRVYRNRASWMVAVILLALFNTLSNLVPSFVSGAVSFLLLIVLIVVVFAFVDSSILTTLEMDFFHRNTLRWRGARVIAYPLLYGDIAISVSLDFVSGASGSPAWLSALTASPAYTLQAAVVVFGVLGYSGAALLVGARRTPDLVVKRHLILVGFAFSIFIVATANDLTVSSAVLNDFLTVLASAVIYFATMALSPIGRVEKGGRPEAVQTPAVGRVGA